MRRRLMRRSRLKQHTRVAASSTANVSSMMMESGRSNVMTALQRGRVDTLDDTFDSHGNRISDAAHAPLEQRHAAAAQFDRRLRRRAEHDRLADFQIHYPAQ